MRENLILLHGALGSQEQMKFIERSLKSKYNTWSFDFDGHGKSKEKAVFSMELFVKNTIEFMQKNKIESSHFFGYSMGGYVALHLAKDQPGKAKKIFTLGTKFSWNPLSAQKEISLLQADRIEKKVPQFAAALNERHLDWKTVMYKTAQMMLELGESKALKMDDFSKIANEILLVIGGQDKMVSIEETAEIAQALINGNHLVVNDFPHALEQIKIEKLRTLMHTFYSKDV